METLQTEQELNEKFAKLVLGWREYKPGWRNSNNAYKASIPNFSTDLTAVWAGVERLEFDYVEIIKDRDGWYCNFESCGISQVITRPTPAAALRDALLEASL